MILLSRPGLSDELQSRLDELTVQIERVRAEHARAVTQARLLWRNTTIRRNIRGPVLENLREMAAGREFCMYCGDNQGTDIDHHEPVQRAPARTFEWNNHILSCSHCNSSSKQGRYPVDEEGQALLLDPTREDPIPHLALSLTTGVYRGLSRRGDATIEVCGLNRYLLTRGRVNARGVIERFLIAWSLMRRQNREAKALQTLVLLKEQPFADVLECMLRYAVAPGAEAIFEDDRESLAFLRDPAVRRVLSLRA